jgi:hypothetical protein
MRRAVVRGILAGVVLVAVAGAAPPAAAQTAAATVAAQKRFHEGLDMVKRSDFEGARVAFQQAYSVLKKPDILWNLALAEEKSGHLSDALVHFKQIVRDDPDNRAGAHNHVDALNMETGHIEVKAPVGTTITIDDGAQPPVTAPLADVVDVMPGHHKLAAKLDQGNKEISVESTAGDTAHVSFMVADGAMTASTAAAPATTASPTDTQPPSAPGTTATGAPIPSDTGTPGTGHSFWTPRTVTVVALGGVAVVGIVAGVGFAVASGNEKTKADGLRQTNGPNGCIGSNSQSCQDQANDVRAQNTDATISTVMFVGAGVLAAGAVAAWFFWPKDKQASSVTHVRPVVGAGYLGVAGAF